jgi:hypothetical protein
MKVKRAFSPSQLTSIDRSGILAAVTAMSESPRFTRVTSEWKAADRWEAFRCRLGMHRSPHRVEPGLYCIGRPGPDSPVLVTANYTLTFDILRHDMGGLGCWILVLDTGGMSVACGVHTGSFSTDELITRMQKTRLPEVVSRRALILPQRGAQAVSAEEVRRRAGFEIIRGPERSGELSSFIARGARGTSEMTAVRFSLRDRLSLSLAEMARSVLLFPVFAFGALIAAGLGPDGVSLQRAWVGVWPLFALGLGSICAGSLVVPAALPLIPFRAFWIKGWLAGAAVTAVLLHGAGLARGMDPLYLAACWLFFPAAGAALGLRFAGATPPGFHTGAGKEIRRAWPFFTAAALLAGAALVLFSTTRIHP